MNAAAVAAAINDNGFILAVSRILVPSAVDGATQFATGLPGDFDSAELAQVVGAVHAVAGGVHPFGQRAPLDGDVYSRHTLLARQGEDAQGTPAA